MRQAVQLGFQPFWRLAWREENCSAGGGGVTRRPIFPTPCPRSLAAVTGGGVQGGGARPAVPGGGGFGMMPWCDDLVCSWRCLLADRHSLPFPLTLSLHRRWCPSASHHPLTFLCLPALSSPLPFPFPSLGLSLRRPQCPSAGGGRVNPTSMPQNDTHVALIILTTQMWGGGNYWWKKLFRAKICVPAPSAPTSVLTQNKEPYTEPHFSNPPPSFGGRPCHPPRRAIFRSPLAGWDLTGTFSCSGICSWLQMSHARYPPPLQSPPPMS